MANIDLNHIAKLARLHFEPKELALFGSQASDILTYVEKLKEVDVAGIEPTSHPLKPINVYREDEPAPPIDLKDFFLQAPSVRGRFFEVPRVIENNQ